ncbi:tyrosine-type recombinase/integrase [Aquibaculum sediminis]|uniref:tyrosine-type recombinase/integrase n=1 Tax=Aquibaculum sediminis TaxID=3231907 RepID=UPI003455D1A9
MRAEGCSDSYTRRTLAVLQGAMNRALREGELQTAPHIALPAEAEARERVASVEEVARLLRAAESEHLRRYLLLAIGTAARPEAILQLATFQCDLEARVIKLNPPGRRQNKKRRPTLPMAGFLVPLIRDAEPGLLVAYRPHNARPDSDPRPMKSIRSPFRRLVARAQLQARQEAAPRVRALWRSGQREAAWKALQQARAAADALLEITPYTLRHTVATELRKRGVPVWEVAGFLGHSSGYKTTERYAKIGPDHLAECVRALEAYFVDLRGKLGGDPLWSDFHPSACQLRASEPWKVVEPSGIEPLTSTMPL